MGTCARSTENTEETIANSQVTATTTNERRKEQTNGTNLSATSVRINGHEEEEDGRGRARVRTDDGRGVADADGCRVLCTCPSSPLMAPNLARQINRCRLPERDPKRLLGVGTKFKISAPCSSSIQISDSPRYNTANSRVLLPDLAFLTSTPWF